MLLNADLLRQGREDRLQQLAQPRTDLWQRCARIRLQEEHEQLQVGRAAGRARPHGACAATPAAAATYATPHSLSVTPPHLPSPQECTFAPQTGRPPARHRLAPGVPVEERLTLSQAGRAEALERARREKERKVLADCTFAPQLVTQPERLLAGQYTPPHRRLGEEARRRTTRLAQAALSHVRTGAWVGVEAWWGECVRAGESRGHVTMGAPPQQPLLPSITSACLPLQGLGEADLTFQPQLNPRSLQLAAEKEARELYEEPGGMRRPRSAPRSAGAEERSCTFAPEINRVSERLLEDSSTVPSGALAERAQQLCLHGWCLCCMTRSPKRCPSATALPCPFLSLSCRLPGASALLFSAEAGQ